MFTRAQGMNRESGSYYPRYITQDPRRRRGGAWRDQDGNLQPTPVALGGKLSADHDFSGFEAAFGAPEGSAAAREGEVPGGEAGGPPALRPSSTGTEYRIRDGVYGKTSDMGSALEAAIPGWARLAPSARAEALRGYRAQQGPAVVGDVTGRAGGFVTPQTDWKAAGASRGMKHFVSKYGTGSVGTVGSIAAANPTGVAQPAYAPPRGDVAALKEIPALPPAPAVAMPAKPAAGVGPVALPTKPAGPAGSAAFQAGATISRGMENALTNAMTTGARVAEMPGVLAARARKGVQDFSRGLGVGDPIEVARNPVEAMRRAFGWGAKRKDKEQLAQGAY